MNAQALILEIAHDMGLDIAGIVRLGPPRDAKRFEQWIRAGHGADMDWLERNKSRIMDPSGLSKGPGALLMVGLSHVRPPVKLGGGGRIARYAAGRDYHNRLGKLLIRLGKRLDREGVLDSGRSGRAMTDAAPLLERSHAGEAGLGFPSKAANLLHPEFGPWFFLGELVLEGNVDDVLQDGPSPPPAGSCGTCTACVDACPTGAIVVEGIVDARKCISYQTIENRGPLPHEIRPQLSGFVFGCDICSEVCPWGIRAEARRDSSQDWGVHPVVEELGLLDWLSQDKDSFKETWRGSPLQRAKREGLARNAALALGNTPQEGSQEALLNALNNHDSPMVRESAAWALASAHGDQATVREALDHAHQTEADPAWKALLQRAQAQAHPKS